MLYSKVDISAHFDYFLCLLFFSTSPDYSGPLSRKGDGRGLDRVIFARLQGLLT
jgi:hypothetical protein